MLWVNILYKRFGHVLKNVEIVALRIKAQLFTVFVEKLAINI